MDQAGGVVGVHPVGQGGVVGPVARLVAQRPDDDGGVVLVPLHHALAALHESQPPLGVLAELVPNPVGLDVGLVHDVEADLVTQVQPARVVGIVRGAHGVEVVLLHQANILQHRLDGHGLAPIGVVVVAVHALYDDRHAIDAYLAIRQLDLAKAHPAALHLQARALGIAQGHQQGVEGGLLSRPLGRGLDRGGEIQRTLAARVRRDLTSARRHDQLALAIVERDLDGVRPRRLGGIAHDRDLHLERGVAVVAVQLGPHI